MIFFTGDTHRDYDYLKVKRLASKLPKLTSDKENYLIVAGDFGCIWGYPNDGELVNHEDMLVIRELYESLPFITLFVDGNHENHKVLNALPVTTAWGGRVHEITPYCFHLLRGEVYNIQGFKIFAMGGAYSVDKGYRKPDVSWWEEELITQDDYNNAMSNLERHHNKVDYIVTHTCPTPVAKELEKCLPPYDVGLWGRKKFDPSCAFLEDIRHQVQFKDWVYGHFHIDNTLVYEGQQFRCLYENVTGSDEDDKEE